MSYILYIGDDNEKSTSGHRAAALQRIGHTLVICNPSTMIRSSLLFNFLSPIHYRTGYIFLQYIVKIWLLGIIQKHPSVDLIWIDSGELFGPECIKELKMKGFPVILYNVDDPTGKRDGGRFTSLKRSLPFYNLVVVVRKESEEECRLLGATHVMRVFRSYDEVAHRPFEHITDIPSIFRSDVAFIGTWMRNEKRDEFIMKLAEKGILVSIWGDRWEKSPFWDQLKVGYRGRALGGRDYVAAMQGAKVCLGFLSKGNRDLHTQRSLEVPYAQGLFCAERTVEHLAMYEDGKEAMFWNDVEECAVKCKELIENEDLCEIIKFASREKVMKLGVGNEDICKSILERLTFLESNKK